MSHHIGLGVLIVASQFVITRAGVADCIDYGEYIHRIGSVGFPAMARNVAVQGGFAFVAGSSFTVVEVSNPEAPKIVAAIHPEDFEILDVALAGEWAFVAAGVGGLEVIDVSDPLNPTIVSRADTPGWASEIALAGSLALVAADNPGLQIIDLSNPTAPVVVGSVNTPGWAIDVAVAGQLAYVADEIGFSVVGFSNPTAPTLIGSLALPGIVQSVAVSGGYAYVACGEEGLKVVDISNYALQPASAGWVKVTEHHAALWRDTLGVERRPLAVYEEAGSWS